MGGKRLYSKPCSPMAQSWTWPDPHAVSLLGHIKWRLVAVGQPRLSALARRTLNCGTSPHFARVLPRPAFGYQRRAMGRRLRAPDFVIRMPVVQTAHNGRVTDAFAYDWSQWMYRDGHRCVE